MARKLTTFKTTSGFFDLAVAAPSKAAALRAWGTHTNLFRQGFAEEVDDPAIVAAAMAKPGIVLRRAVGSSGRFNEHADLPKHLPHDVAEPKPRKRTEKKIEHTSGAADEKAERKAAAAFEQEESRRETKRRRDEARELKRRRKRATALAAAEARLDAAREAHQSRSSQIDQDRAAIDRRSEMENRRWEAQKRKLEKTVRRARASDLP